MTTTLPSARIDELLAASWQRAAMAETVRRITSMMTWGDVPLSKADDALVEHINGMPERMTEDFSDAKIGRWLGWVQGVACAKGWLHLDDCKRINKEASDAHVAPSPSPAKGEAEPVAALEKAEMAARDIMPYLEWQLSPESPGHHPTFGSAVAAFRGAFAPEVFAPGSSRFDKWHEERRAALASPLPVEDRQVRVKPLEWGKTSTYSYADTPFGEYTVQHYTESEGPGWSAVFCDNAEIGYFPTDLIACSACQADYESRILSALSPSTLGGEK